MSALVRYPDAPHPVRRDLVAAHERQWQRLAEPGTWWTGAERVDLAAEVRQAGRCALCHERKAALSPASVDGEHDGDGRLPAAAVDVVHRLTTDPGRLSKAWFEKSLAGGLSDGHYVEIVGVVVTVVSIDAFTRGLGLPPHALPEPRPGPPSRYRPASARPEGAWVPMIPMFGNKGAEADLWDKLTGNVIRAMSLVPDEVRGLLDLSAAHYGSSEQLTDFSRGTGVLDRSQTELVAGRVSALNECFY